MSVSLSFAVALAIVIVAALALSTVNGGVLAAAFALLLGAAFHEAGLDAAVAAFPTRLAFALFGLTVFFSALAGNGTVERLASSFLGLVGRRVVLLPLAFFVLVSALTAAGVGNVAVVALLAPMGLRVAARAGLPDLLMILVLVGAANAASLSPFSPAGVIVRDFARGNPSFDPGSAWRLAIGAFAVQSTVVCVAFHLLGGTAWVRTAWRARSERNVEGDLRIGTAQRTSLVVFASFVGLTLLPAVPGAVGLFPPAFWSVATNPGASALVAAVVLSLLGAVDLRTSIARLPWDALLLVLGMSTLIGLAESMGVVKDLSDALLAHASPVPFVFLSSLAAAALSAVSSSTGVVLPLFLPLARDAATAWTAIDGPSLALSFGVSAHLVDASPLSTLGALCLAASGREGEERARLFRSLLLLGIALIPIAALVGGLLALPR